jgi:Flp pilus assembly protein TadG
MRASRTPVFPAARRGTALAIVAVMLVPIIGVLALVVDGGFLMAERQHAQAVADSAAQAAAITLYQNGGQISTSTPDPGGQAKKIALANASANGYANDGTTSTVTVNIPPKSGLFINKLNYAEVIVQNNAERLFSALWGAGTMSVTARSVARGQGQTANPAILLLDPTMARALDGTGNGNVTVTGGSIVIDSSNRQAGVLTGNGNISAPNVNFYGNYNTTGSGEFASTVKTGVAPTADPLLSLPVPDPTTMTVQSSNNYQVSSSGNYTLQPGVYRGGISLSGPSPGTVTLMPGIYYMQGGGFSISGGLSVSGSGVTIYNAPVKNNESVSLSGNGSLTLSPPTSGAYKGIAIFQERSATAEVDITGNGSMNLTGTIYAAGATVELTGNGGSNVMGSQIIADSMTVTGNGSVSVNYDPTSGPAKDVRIVE